MQELEKYNTPDLVQEISFLIEESKQQVVRTANSALTILFWHVGKRINDEILKNDRAQYGKQIIATVSAQLELKYGRYFTEKNLKRMIKFYQEFSVFNIFPPLVAKLTWSHFIELFPLKSIESKIYYAQSAIENNWGKRELRNQIECKAFERNEIANVQLSANQANMEKNAILETLIPILNFNEQQIIVEKVNAKTGLCDELEKGVEGREKNEVLLKMVLSTGLEMNNKNVEV